jgi:diguanylate cyclase (GGDEF)-like protein
MSHAIFVITAFLLPLDFLALSILKEDAVSILRGAIRVALVLAQPFLVLWLCDPEQQAIIASVQQTSLVWLATGWTPIPQPALFAFALAGAIHLARFVLHRDPLEAGSFWALAAIFLAYHGRQYGWHPTNFFAAGGLILFLSLLQSAHQRTYRDELTGIAGRLAYEEAVGQLGKEFSLAVLAVDQLKSYSNVHGKSVGEQILKLIAPKVQAACQGGRVFRVSGEELTVLFPNHSAVETLAALEAVRKIIATTSLILRGRDRVLEDVHGGSHMGSRDHQLPVTASVGVAEKINDAATVSLVLKAAYRALYEAKSAGGNNVKRGTLNREPARPSLGKSGRVVVGREY